MTAGRPSDYTEEIAETICTRIACGESILDIAADPEMPGQRTIYAWLYRHEEFQQKYARAREAQMEVYADQIIAIADDTVNDTHTTTYDGGREVTSPNTEWISRARLRCDMRKWKMSKLAPKKYGDKLEQTLQGPDGSPLTVSWKKAE